MEYHNFFRDGAFALFRFLLYSMFCVCAGIAVVGVSVYVILLSSEILSSSPRSKLQPPKTARSTHDNLVLEKTLAAQGAEIVVSAAPEPLEKKVVRLFDVQRPMAVSAVWKSEMLRDQFSFRLEEEDFQ